MVKNIDDNFKQLIRLCGVDIDGNKRIYHALTKIKGVSFSFSNVLCKIANLAKWMKIGNIGDKSRTSKTGIEILFCYDSLTYICFFLSLVYVKIHFLWVLYIIFPGVYL